MPSTELLAAIQKKQTDAVLKMLDEEPGLLNTYFDDGTTALYQAIMSGQHELVNALIAKGVDVNQVTKAPAVPTGVTPIMTAIWQQQLETVQAIIASNKTIRLDSDTPGGHNALTNAVDKGNPAIVKLVLGLPGAEKSIDKKRNVDGKSALDLAIEKNNPDIIIEIVGAKKTLSFSMWLKAQRKLPSDSLAAAYVKELKENKAGKGVVKEAVLARKLWTDMVSDMDRVNVEYGKRNNSKEEVIERLKKLGYDKNVEAVYQDCIAYLQTCPVVMTFNAKTTVESGLSTYQALNAFEISYDKKYQDSRAVVEKKLFQDLTKDTSQVYDEKYRMVKLEESQSSQSNIWQAFENNSHANPRYAKLELLDRHHPIQAISAYGKSYIVFNKVVNLNSLSVPSNPYIHHGLGKSYVPATYSQWDVFLHQCSDKKLKALAARVTTGCLTADYDPKSPREDGYVTVLIPSIDLLDPHFIQHIHVSTEEYVLKAEETRALQAMGITITNSASNPYPELSEKLMTYIEQNNITGVSELLKSYPVLMNISNTAGETPLEIAVRLGHQEMVLSLEKRGADSGMMLQRKLLACIESNDTQEAKKLIKELKRIKKNPAAIIQTAFVHAVIKKNADIRSLLMEPGADEKALNHKNKNSESALFIAARQGDLKTVQILLTEPAIDFEAKRIPGDEKTAYQIALENNQSEAALALKMHQIKHLKETKSDATEEEKNLVNLKNQAFHHTVKEKDIAGMMQWISMDVDPNVENRDGKTALHHAVERNDLEMVEALLNTPGININPICQLVEPIVDGVTPLYLACNNEKTDMLALLIAKGADVSVPMTDGHTPLTNAAHNNKLDHVTMLLKLNKIDNNSIVKPSGDTALIYAARTGTAAMVQAIVLSPGIEMNHKNAAGESALFIAVKTGDMAKIRVLLDIPHIDLAAKRFPGGDGKTALQMAIDNKQPEIALRIAKQAMDVLKNKDRYGLESVVNARESFKQSADALFSLAVDKGDLNLMTTCVAHGADPNKKLDALIAAINKYPLGKDQELNQAINEFKKSANEAYAETVNENLFENSYNALIIKANNFRELSECMLSINSIVAESNDERKKAIEAFKSQAKILYVKGDLKGLKDKIKEFLDLDECVQQVLKTSKTYRGQDPVWLKLTYVINDAANNAYKQYAERKKTGEKLAEDLLGLVQGWQKSTNTPTNIYRGRLRFLGKCNSLGKSEIQLNEEISKIVNRKKSS